MKKRFMSKTKKKSKFKLSIFIFIIIFIMSFSFIYKNLSINLSNEVIISYILNNTEDNLDFSKIVSPEFLLNYTFNTEYDFSTPVMNEISSEPLVYIYNTHPTEYYAQTNFEVFNIVPTVVTASYILEEYLESLGINVIVEENSVADYLSENNMAYSESYDASRVFLTQAIETYPSLEYFIDIHRDAATKETTTTSIDGESCIKLMFVVGKEYDTYEKNYELAQSVNNKILEISSDFSRGISLKEGSGVNGVYNGDVDENVLLVEAGAQYNTIDEVNCGMKYLSEVLYSVIMREE